MRLSMSPRCVALGLILTACVRGQPAPPILAPLPPASGAPIAIATNAGKGQYPLPPPPQARQPVASKGTRGAIRDKAPGLEKVTDLVPDPSDVVEQVTATANELLGLAQDVQNKVIAALTANA